MPADPVLARELKSLQEEVTAAQRQHQTAALATPAGGGTSTAAPTAAIDSGTPETIADELAVRDQLAELVQQVTDFFQDAEKNIAAHPAESVIGALLLGILIGRVLGRG